MQFYVEQNILSCTCSLVMRGTDVLDYRTFGYMDIEQQRPLLEDAIYRIYSNTKIVTSVALMMLYEEGRFSLDDALAEYMPEFADVRVLDTNAQSANDTHAAQSPITIRQILSHSAGFSYGFIEPESLIDQTYIQGGLNVLFDSSIDLEELCARLAKMPLAYQPGTAWRYSLASDVCARLIEVLSGQPFDVFLKQRIFTPLQMVDTDFWVPPEKADRFITMYAPQDLFDPMKPGLNKADDPIEGQYNQPRVLKSGGGGLVSTVADYLRFLQMIVNGGEWQGQRLLQPQTLALMRTNQLAQGVGVSFPMWDMPGTVFGLGFALKAQLGEGDPAAGLNEYHWGGMAGTHTWMAPEPELTGMCFTQLMPGFWHPFSHEFRALAYQLAG